MLKIIGRLVMVFILLVLAAAWYAQERYSNEALLERYNLKPDLVLIQKAVSNTDLLAAVDAYRDQSYQVSDSLLLDLLPDDADFVFGEYLLGHSYLKNERISNAILSFESVRDYGNSPVQDDAAWMAVMALIRRGRMDEAKNTMQAMGKNTSFTHNSKAKNLQDDLGAWWRKMTFLK